MSLGVSSKQRQNNFKAFNSNDVSTYEFANFQLDTAHLMLYQSGEATSLTPKVVETLVALVERRGEVVGKDELMDRLWQDTAVGESNLSQNLYVLRKTLGNRADGLPFIETFRRRGYRFNGEIKSPPEVELLVATHTKTQIVIEETVEQGITHSRWSALISALALVVIFGGATFGVLSFFPNYFSAEVRNPAATPFDNFTLKRHSDSSDVTAAVTSSDGKFIAYNDKNSAIWIRNVATESNINILAGSETVGRTVIAISPDNNFLYFANRYNSKSLEVAKMSLFGGPELKTQIADVWSGTVLSPDEKLLSFTRHGLTSGRTSIIVANMNGSGERTIAVGDADTWFGVWSQSTAWSPDGGRLAVSGETSRDGSLNRFIKTFDVADGRELSVINLDSAWKSVEAVLWLPDGDNMLVLGKKTSSEGQIFRYTISTDSWRRLTNDLNNYYTLSATGDGKSIVSIQLDENTGNLWTMPVGGDPNEAVQITSGRSRLTDATGLSWTPDRKIVYAKETAGKWGIWVIDADGSNPKELTQNCAGNDMCSQPFVSPDGKLIIFQADRNGKGNIWRMNIDGSEPIQLTTEGGVYPSMSVDGRFVMYTLATATAWTLWQIPVEGGEPQRFGKIPADSASVSPDGKNIAFHYYDAQADQPFQTCVAPVSLGTPEKCFGNSRSIPRWASDSGSFYYLDPGYAGIWKQPLHGKPSLFLRFEGEETTNFALSRDGKSFVVARSNPTQDIVALTDAH